MLLPWTRNSPKLKVYIRQKLRQQVQLPCQVEVEVQGQCHICRLCWYTDCNWPGTPGPQRLFVQQDQKSPYLVLIFRLYQDQLFLLSGEKYRLLPVFFWQEERDCLLRISDNIFSTEKLGCLLKSGLFFFFFQVQKVFFSTECLFLW